MTSNFEDRINKGEDDESQITGYKRSTIKNAFTYIGYGCTAFLLRLLFFWLPHLHVKSTHIPCSLQEADKILVRDQYEQQFVESIVIVSATGVGLKKSGNGHILHSSNCSTNRPCVDGNSAEAGVAASSASLHYASSSTALHNGFCPGVPEDSTFRYFMHKKIKYIWKPSEGRFARNDVFTNTSCKFFHETTGLEDAQARLEFVKYGENRVHIPLTPIWKLIIVQGLHPFYAFQLFSVILWLVQDYTIYAMVIIAMSCISLSVTIFLTARNERNLRKTLVDSSNVSVVRGSDSAVTEIDSSRLVPGDIIEIPQSGCLVQCDAVLIAGNCIVNESMLTGESVPILKTPAPSEDSRFGLKEHAKHVLFCGTRVIQTRHAEAVRAVVVRTGFMTSKGELVRSILFPKPNVFTFNRDVINYLEVLSLFAAAGFIYTVVLMHQHGEEAGKIVIRALDLITIAVPPALPAAMTFGIVFAQARLRQRSIFCIAPKTINVSGAVNLVCFDKTGTLTESGMDLWGVAPALKSVFLTPTRSPAALTQPCQLLEAMASCHALTRIDSELSGDPLDLKMFHSSGWEIQEPDTIDYSRCDRLVNLLVWSPVTGAELGIVRQFPFSSDLQRMSVIASRINGRQDEPLLAFVKGSPEMIYSLCLPNTVPPDFHDQLMQYTSLGYRVIALAHRHLPPGVTVQSAQKLNRGDVERDLQFLGLLVMENRLKPETAASIATLLNAIFARFSPVQKSQLVETLQELGYTVAMCGDGANDCGALKTAHAGISLSEAEASVASPFTSKEQNISCVLRLIQEGRCALVTSFGIFKFMACYSMCQFVSVLILYWINSNLTNNQFVYIDLFLITTHFITFSYTAAYDGIAKEPPSHRLLSFVTCTSIVLQCGIFVGFQTIVYFYVKWQPWFYPFVYDSDTELMACYENTAIFLISLNQYVILAVVFSKSAPYRRVMFSNYAFVINIAAVVGVNLFVIFAPRAWLGVLLETWDAPRDNPNLSLKFLLVGASLMNCLLSLLVELLVESVWFGRLVRRIGRRIADKPKEFERVVRQLKLERGEWPPINVHLQRAGQRELLNFVAQGAVNAADDGGGVTGTTEISMEMKPVGTERPKGDSVNRRHKRKKHYTAL